jgi:hypothetical protein
VLLLLPSGVQIKQQHAVPSFFGSAIDYNNNSILLANSRTFVVYNYLTGQTKPLGSDNIFDDSLYNVDSLSLSSDKQFIVFHSLQPPVGSYLYSLVQSAQGQNTGYLGYWFVYDIQSQQYMLLPGNTIKAVAYGNEVYGLSIDTNGQESITAYKDNGLSQISSINVPGTSSFYPVSGGYLLNRPNNQVLFTNNGIVVQKLYSSSVIIGVSSDGNDAIGTINSGNSSSLAVFNFRSSSYRIVAKNINSNPVWSSITNQALYLTNLTGSSTGQLNLYSLSSNKTSLLKLSNELNTSVTPILPVGQNDAVVSLNRSSFLLIGNNLSNVKIPSGNYSRIINVGGQSISIVYSQQNNALMINALNNAQLDVAGQQNAIYSQLQNDGYNPYLISILNANNFR